MLECLLDELFILMVFWLIVIKLLYKYWYNVIYKIKYFREIYINIYVIEK